MALGDVVLVCHFEFHTIILYIHTIIFWGVGASPQPTSNDTDILPMYIIYSEMHLSFLMTLRNNIGIVYAPIKLMREQRFREINIIPGDI